MKLIRTTPTNYLFKAGRKIVPFVRVSTILDWHFGPVKGDPENNKWLARFGTMVHQSIDRRKPLPGTEGHVAAARDFMRSINFATIERERVVVSSRWRYAGRLDRIGKGNGLMTLIDWKTGTFGERGEVQLNLYDLANDEEFGDRSPMLYGVELTEKGYKAKIVEKNWAKALGIVQKYHESRGAK